MALKIVYNLCRALHPKLYYYNADTAFRTCSFKLFFNFFRGYKVASKSVGELCAVFVDIEIVN